MGPDRNSVLFEAVGQPRIEALDEEFDRRTLLSQRLSELSELFDTKDHTSHPVTESTIFARLYALSRLQRTQMSIAGFTGMEPIDLSRGRAEINAKVAPHHDEFRTRSNGEDGNEKIYRTRVIKITMPESDYGSRDNHIEIFGINLYQLEPSKELTTHGPESSEADPGANGYLVLIGKAGQVQRKPEPITGETVIIAVRNTETNDAKLYSATFISPEDQDLEGFNPKEITHKSANEAIVTLPDNNQIAITALSGEALTQAVAELSLAIDRLEALKDADETLSDDEHAAAKNALATS